MHSWYLLLFASLGPFGCAPHPDSDRPLPDPEAGVPEIGALKLTCDADEATWTLRVEATAWTGGGTLYLSRGEGYFEAHPVRAIKSAADGSAETLRLDLDVSSDWRDQSPGSSTVFGCAGDTSWRFVLDDLDDVPVDCEEHAPASLPADVPQCP